MGPGALAAVEGSHRSSAIYDSPPQAVNVVQCTAMLLDTCSDANDQRPWAYGSSPQGMTRTSSGVMPSTKRCCTSWKRWLCCRLIGRGESAYTCLSCTRHLLKLYQTSHGRPVAGLRCGTPLRLVAALCCCCQGDTAQPRLQEVPAGGTVWQVRQEMPRER